MVFGTDLVENVESLSQSMDHVEIIIFHTLQCHKIPTDEEIIRLKRSRQKRSSLFPCTCRHLSKLLLRKYLK
jgi:hypothetical protein